MDTESTARITQAPASLLERHGGLVAAAGFATFTGALLVRVAHGSAPTALAVLQAGGTAETLMGTAITLVPFVGVALLGSALVVLWSKSHLTSQVGGWRRLAWTLGCLLVGAMFLSPFYLPVAVLVAIGVRRSKSEAGGSAVPLVIVTMVWLILYAAPWWPLERIEVAGTKRVLVGYVVAMDGRDAAILLDAPRRLVHVGPVVKRSICEGSTLDRLIGRESLWSLLADRNGYPLCAE